MSEKIPVAVLGATGAVGQKFIKLLQDHPWFEVTQVAASDRSVGRRYEEVVAWKQNTPIPESVRILEVRPCTPDLDCRIAFSGLDAAVAGEVEDSFARAGCVVLSNSKNHRMDADVPLVIPELNHDHLGLIPIQRRNRGTSGFIVTNSNCSTMFLAMALGPLHRAFTVEKVFVATMQAVSGAGYPGVPSLDILGNVIPDIPEEGAKIEREVARILGRMRDGAVVPAPFTISAMTYRVAVEDGHTESVSAGFSRRASAS